MEAVMIAVLPKLIDVAAVAIAGFATYLLGKIKKQATAKGIRDLATDALEMAVAETYDEMVQRLKRDAADGKLTASERRAAQDLAIAKAKVIMSSQGHDLLAILSERAIRGAIAKIVEESK